MVSNILKPICENIPKLQQKSASVQKHMEVKAKNFGGKDTYYAITVKRKERIVQLTLIKMCAVWFQMEFFFNLHTVRGFIQVII